MPAVNAMVMKPRTRRASIGSGLATAAHASVSSDLYAFYLRAIAGAMQPLPELVELHGYAEPSGAVSF